MSYLLLYLFCVVVVVEAITELAVKSQIFLPFRRWVSSKSQFLKELLHCGYCFSVWVSLFSVSTLGTVIPLTGRGILDLAVTVLIVHRLSNVLHNVIDKWTDKYYDTRFVNTDKGMD